MNIDTICALCIEALRNAGYNESTVFNYQGVIRRFKAFCKAKNVQEYTTKLGKLYADDVISRKTGKFSQNRYHTQGRFIRLINSYIRDGQFDFNVAARGKVLPDNEKHKVIYAGYCYFLSETYENENTVWQCF